MNMKLNNNKFFNFNVRSKIGFMISNLIIYLLFNGININIGLKQYFIRSLSVYIKKDRVTKKYKYK